jgi:hypothetical protein
MTLIRAANYAALSTVVCTVLMIPTGGVGVCGPQNDVGAFFFCGFLLSFLASLLMYVVAGIRRLARRS